MLRKDRNEENGNGEWTERKAGKREGRGRKGRDNENEEKKMRSVTIKLSPDKRLRGCIETGHGSSERRDFGVLLQSSTPKV